MIITGAATTRRSGRGETRREERVGVRGCSTSGSTARACFVTPPEFPKEGVLCARARAEILFRLMLRATGGSRFGGWRAGFGI